jgi:hypothetical protein
MEKALNDAETHDQPRIAWTATPSSGSTVLMWVEHDRDEHSIEYDLLCVTKGHQPFVTYRLITGVEQMSDGKYRAIVPYTIWGHFFEGLQEAMDDFWGR